MNVLGIIGFGQNPSACILRDGKIVAFAEEERFTRIKGSHKMFPEKATAFCLSYANLTLDAIDKIAFGWDSKRYPLGVGRNFASNYLKYKGRERRSYHKERDPFSLVAAAETLMEYNPTRIRSRIKEGLRAAGLKGDFPKIEFVTHHLAHAYSTYFCSGFNRAGILTIDGSGEDICTQLAIGEGDNIRILESFPIPDSLGWFYASITEYLGFIPYRDEGKVMGLAAYGEERKMKNKWIEPLSRILKIKDNSYEVDPIYTKFGDHYYGSRYTDQMVKFITDVDPDATPVYYGQKAEIKGELKSRYLLDLYIDMAWAAQELLERAAIMLAKRLVEKYNMENLCIAGGVGLNCKMNGEILRRSGCKRFFVQPASSDAGSALGAAMYVAKENGEDIRNPLKNVYTGPEFSNDEIRALLNNCKLNFRETENPAGAASKLLEEGKIVAWFQGRMEFGPRALGGRSILANPLIRDMKDRVNAEVKYRESWRPFCPSILDDVKEAYMENAAEAPFMIVAYHIQENKRSDVGGVVHVDGTIRPQTVTKKQNPLYYNLIADLGRRTGNPVVLNTSFNVRGKPIICTPREAVSCFYSNGLDALVMGNFIVEKEQP